MQRAGGPDCCKGEFDRGGRTPCVRRMTATQIMREIEPLPPEEQAKVVQSASRRRLLADPAHAFHCPHFLVVELFKHKERIARASSLKEDELLECFHERLARVTVIGEGTLAVGVGWRPGVYAGRSAQKMLPSSRSPCTSTARFGPMTRS